MSLRQKGDAAPATPAAGTGPAAPVIPAGPQRLSHAQLIMFTEEMSDLLDAGLPLEASLHVIEQRQEASSLRAVAAKVRQLVRDGSSVSNALKASSPSFNDLYCNLVAAGEVSGALPQILRRQVAYLTVMHDLRNTVIQALLYPALILVMGGVLLTFFMVNLVPNLMMLFEKTEQKMPIATRALISASRLFSNWWWAMLLLLVLGAFLFRALIRSPAGKEWWARSSYKLPLIGPVLQSRFLAQFCQTLANLVGNGLPLLTGLTLMEKATSNAWLRGRLTIVSGIVSEGGSLSRAMRRAGGFPELFQDLVAVGEQTGDLATALEKAAARYEKEMRIRIQRITALVGPVVLIAIALILGVMIYSIITSIFQAISGLRVRG